MLNPAIVADQHYQISQAVRQTLANDKESVKIKPAANLQTVL